MAKDLFSRFIWLIDTLRRHDGLTRAEIDAEWQASGMDDGNPLPERTFFYYRRAIEQNFHIDIECDSSGRYRVVSPETDSRKAFSNWLLDSYAVRTAISEEGDDAPIMVDEVPSAREFLPSALEAARNKKVIVFDYAGFNRSRVETGIKFLPCFLRLYRQRWYMVGYKERAGVKNIRTYALDRVRGMSITSHRFKAELDPDAVFENIFGVTSSQAPVHRVQLRTSPREAKYLRALPLHKSQREELHDEYSIFTYDLKLNYELVHEILSLGSEVKVVNPPELRAMVLDELNKMRDQYK